MPTDTPDPAAPPAGGDPPPATPPAPSTPPPPSKDDVRAWVKESLAELLAGGAGGTPEPPKLTTDKDIEAYVEAKVAEAMKALNATAPGTPPSPTPSPTPEPEEEPEQKQTWQERLRQTLWGSA